jgi:nicotinate-nucleotide pyrophosphorylase (carboxylating)
LNLVRHLSGVATLTRQFVTAVEGTRAQISDTRQTTPGLRMLEKYAVLLGGGVNGRYGLDDGVCIEPNHAAVGGGLRVAVKSASQRVGHMHRVAAVVATQPEIKEAIEAGATALVLRVKDEEAQSHVQYARELSQTVSIEVDGDITIDNVRQFAESGVDIIRVAALTQSVRAMAIDFQIQAG